MMLQQLARQLDSTALSWENQFSLCASKKGESVCLFLVLAELSKKIRKKNVPRPGIVLLYLDYARAKDDRIAVKQ